MKNGNGRKPWDRREGETEKAWQAFAVFRDLGAERKLEEVARRLKKSGVVLQRWVHKNEWRARVVAWDQELDRARQAVQLKEAAKTGAKFAVSTENVLRRQAESAFFDPGEVLKWSNNGIDLVPSEQLPEHARRQVKGLKFKRDETGETYISGIEFLNPQPATDKLGEFLKLWGGKEEKPSTTNNWLILIDAIKSGELRRVMEQQGILEPKEKDEQAG